MASDPYAAYNRPGDHYEDRTEPVYNPYSFTSGHEDARYTEHDNHYTGYTDDAFVPPAANRQTAEKALPDPSRNTSYSTRLPRE